MLHDGGRKGGRGGIEEGRGREGNKEKKGRKGDKDKKREAPHNKNITLYHILKLNQSIFRKGTGCSLNIVFFSEDFKNIPDSVLSLFSLGVSVCNTHQAGRKTQYLMNTL